MPEDSLLARRFSASTSLAGVSCSPRNNLNFNWRLIKASMRVIEYVIVHELAHLLEPNHNSKFWTVIKSQLPDYWKSREWLRQFGGLLEQQP